MAQAEAHYSVEEYLIAERASDERHEYFRGEIFAMGGAGRRHNLIVTNLVRELSSRLKSEPCDVYSNDMRVKVSDTGLYTYPDVVVVCGDPLLEDEYQDTLLNPTVLIEVLSASTEAYDRGRKFEMYRTLSSFRDYLLVAQDRIRVEHYTRQEGGGWLLTETTDRDASVALLSVGCEVPLGEIYARIGL